MRFKEYFKFVKCYGPSPIVYRHGVSVRTLIYCLLLFPPYEEIKALLEGHEEEFSLGDPW